MKMSDTQLNRHSIGQFAALKTAITNGDESEVKERVGDSTMQSLQRSYLIDLAKLSGNNNIINILKDIKVSD